LPALISGIPDTRENLSSILKKAAAAGVREIDYDPLNFYLAAVFNLRAVFKKHWPRQRLKQPAGSLIITNNTCAVWQRSYWLNMGMNEMQRWGRTPPPHISLCKKTGQTSARGECSGARSFVRSDRAGGCATDRSTF